MTLCVGSPNHRTYTIGQVIFVARVLQKIQKIRKQNAVARQSL